MNEKKKGKNFVGYLFRKTIQKKMNFRDTSFVRKESRKKKACFFVFRDVGQKKQNLQRDGNFWLFEV